MSNYIIKQAKQFQKLVTDNLINTNNCRLIKYIPKITKNLSKNYIYSYKNCLIFPKSKLHDIIPDPDPNSDQLVVIFIMYKNLKYKDNYTYLDRNDKDKIKEILNNIFYKFDINNIFVLGRKYTDKSTGITNINSLSKLCNIYGLYTERAIRSSKTPKVENFTKNYRRDLRENLIKLIPGNYMNDIYKNSIFLDTEYVTDIIDDFSEFPLSKNLAMNFMIGLGILKGTDIAYTNLIIRKLNNDLEYQLLEQFVNYIEQFSKDKEYILLIHWSHADKTSLNNGLLKYPQLKTRFDKINYIFLDLMNVCKSTFYSNSYSLKYIAKNIMNYQYDSDCQNGFDAMISYIESTQQNSKKNDDIINDLVKYNQIDTEILYKLIKYIVG